jgi:hypothetical protein
MDVIDTLSCGYQDPNDEGIITDDLTRILDTLYQNESIDLGTMQVTAGPAPYKARDIINEAEGLPNVPNAVNPSEPQTTTTKTNPSPDYGLSDPLPHGRYCRYSAAGVAVFGGPHTSCIFARKVSDAYANQPNATATLRVYSPTTGKTYTMACTKADSGAVTCTGELGASVGWHG